MSGELVHLDAESVEAVARRVVELLRSESAPPAELLTAAQVAQRFGVSREYVYEHSHGLGAIRLGDGKRPRLRFDAERVRQVLEGANGREGSRESEAPGSPVPAVPLRAARRSATAASARLLPIRGDDA